MGDLGNDVKKQCFYGWPGDLLRFMPAGSRLDLAWCAASSIVAVEVERDPDNWWSIIERRASEILVAQGYPIDDLCEALICEPPGWTPGDIIAAYERGDVANLRADIDRQFPEARKP